MMRKVSTLADNGSSAWIYPVAKKEATPNRVRGNRPSAPKRTMRKARKHNDQSDPIDKKRGRLIEPASEAAFIDLNPSNPDDHLSLYFREMGQVALLSPTEVVALARQIEKGCWAEEEFAAANDNAERAQDLSAYTEAGRQAREHLIRANARLVISMARRYRRLGLPRDANGDQRCLCRAITGQKYPPAGLFQRSAPQITSGFRSVGAISGPKANC